MKKRVSTLIEEKVLSQAKGLAVKEGRPLSDIIQDAIVSYLSDKVSDSRKRQKAYQIFCDQPIRIGKKHFNEILEERAWDE